MDAQDSSGRRANNGSPSRIQAGSKPSHLTLDALLASGERPDDERSVDEDHKAANARQNIEINVEPNSKRSSSRDDGHSLFQ